MRTRRSVIIPVERSEDHEDAIIMPASMVRNCPSCGAAERLFLRDTLCGECGALIPAGITFEGARIAPPYEGKIWGRAELPPKRRSL